MNILVIGNGFDLAHGLPTAYADFIRFGNCFVEKQEKNLKCISFGDAKDVLKENVKEYIFVKSKDILKKEIWNEFEDGFIKNYWVKEFRYDLEPVKWVDFEAKISKKIKEMELSEKKKSSEHFAHNINVLQESLNKLIRCLEIYLSEIVEKLDVVEKIYYFSTLKVDKVLSFNYTNSYERIYNEKQEYQKIQVEYNFIHGSINKSKSIDESTLPNNMVLGIEEYLLDGEKDKNLEFIEFKKYYQRIFKMTGCLYKEWLQEIDEQDIQEGYNVLNEAHIFGHSLNVADGDILKELISQKNLNLKIYYKDNIDYKKYILNLITMIGQDRLISCVYGEDPKIKFLQAPRPIKFNKNISSKEVISG
jgi:hypothetical protein